MQAQGLVAGGQLFTWGRGSDGQLGQAQRNDVRIRNPRDSGRVNPLQDKVRFPSVNCALPHPVPGMTLDHELSKNIIKEYKRS